MAEEVQRPEDALAGLRRRRGVPVRATWNSERPPAAVDGLVGVVPRAHVDPALAALTSPHWLQTMISTPLGDVDQLELLPVAVAAEHPLLA